MGKIIAIANQKGGVGKTTTAVNIAASIGYYGYRILLVDADPQGNATSGFGIQKRTVDRSTYEVLLGQCSAREAILTTPYKGVDLIPSSMALAACGTGTGRYAGSGDAPQGGTGPGQGGV